ncbi:MAG: hypothetical protein AB9866_04580 [Syntrophobacteraceae bacterium]
MSNSFTTKRICQMFVFCTCLALSGGAFAATYWVSPSGAASWASCQSATPLDGTAACSYATANAYAAAGDTVYYRGGTYNISNKTAINPSNSGTSADAKITFSAYLGETPLFQQGTYSIGISIIGKNWIKVTGLTFQDFTGTSLITSGGSYNEISYCNFINITNKSSQSKIFVIGNSNDGAVHNWFHHNYLSGRYNTSPCTEGIDLLRIGMADRIDINNYNTVEYNYLEYSAHANLVTYSKFNVIRGNTGHNEPWIATNDLCTSYDGTKPALDGYNRGSKSSDEQTISLGDKNLTIAKGLANNAQCTATSTPWVCCTGAGAGSCYWSSGSTKPVAMYYEDDWSKAMSGVIKSYNGDTGDITITIKTLHGGSGENYSNWIVSQRNLPKYANTKYDGLYGHRVVNIGDVTAAADPQYNLVEGNRFGNAGVNPNNNGATALDIGSKINLVRYNYVYGSMANGINFKGGTRNYVYNNTAYGNGYGYDFYKYSAGTVNLKGMGQGIGQGGPSGQSGSGSYNVIKNNIVYNNGAGDICYSTDGQVATCTPWTGDIVTNNWTTYGSGQGNPLFVNPDLTDPTSQDLFSNVHGYAATPIPDLSLQSGSGAIDGGTYLTQANGSGSSSTTLVVADANYFQDGTRGSDLTRMAGTMQADWIAIGTVTNVVQISSINYGINTITLASPMSWNDNAPIWLYRKSDGARVLLGASPDLGASEFGTGALTPPGGIRLEQ